MKAAVGYSQAQGINQVLLQVCWLAVKIAPLANNHQFTHIE